MERVYLDHNATTPVRPEVIAVVAETLAACGGNPSSAHGSGRDSSRHLREARERVAACIGARPGEIVFTASGTEANNIAIRGMAAAAGKGTIVTSNLEHPATSYPCADLAEAGFDIRIIPSGSNGRVDPVQFRDQLDDSVVFASLIHSQNETGILQPAREAGESCRYRGIPFHVDAAQSVGKIPIDVRKDPFDLVSIVGHKIYAPKGIGALYIKEGIKIAPFLRGGGQEGGLRPGTENVAFAAGLAVAMELMMEDQQRERARISSMRDRFERELTQSLEGVVVVGADFDRLPGTSLVLFEGLIGFDLGAILDERGLEVSTGSACHSGSPAPSEVLLAMGIDPTLATGAIRVGFGRSNSEKDIDRLVNEMIEGAAILRGGVDHDK